MCFQGKRENYTTDCHSGSVTSTIAFSVSKLNRGFSEKWILRGLFEYSVRVITLHPQKVHYCLVAAGEVTSIRAGLFCCH